MDLKDCGFALHALIEDWLHEHQPDRFGFVLVLHDVDESVTGIYTNLMPAVAGVLVEETADHMAAHDALITDNPMMKATH